MNVEFLLPEAHQNDDDDVEMPDVSDKFVTPGETISVNAQYMRFGIDAIIIFTL